MSANTRKELTDEQQIILKEFRERVEDVLKPEHDDRFLLRWLRARGFDQDKAEIMLRKNAAWRKRMAADSLQKRKIPEALLKYAPQLFLGFDKMGHSVRLLPQENVDYKGIVASVRKNDIIKSVCSLYEQDSEAMRINNQTTGFDAETYVYIIDYHGFSIMQLSSKAVWDVVIDMLKIFEANYPESLKTAYLINIPPMFYPLFATVKPLLAEETKKKFEFYGRDGWKEALLKTIDPEVLPVHYGGTRVDEFGDPKCSSLISQAGTVPESYYLKNQYSLSECSGSQKIVVPNRAVQDVEVVVQQDDSLIEWETECDGEIDVSLFYLKKVFARDQSDELYPVEKVAPTVKTCCYLPSEVGSFYCEKAGLYTMQFDNKFSTFRQKEVTYRLSVLPPGDY